MIRQEPFIPGFLFFLICPDHKHTLDTVTFRIAGPVIRFSFVAAGYSSTEELYRRMVIRHVWKWHDTVLCPVGSLLLCSDLASPSTKREDHVFRLGIVFMGHNVILGMISICCLLYE